MTREEKNETTAFEYWPLDNMGAFLSESFKCDHGGVVTFFFKKAFIS